MPQSQGKYVLKRHKAGHSLSKKQAREVQRQIKQQLKKRDELKYFKYETGIEMAPNATGATAYWRSFNIFFHNVSRGGGDNQFIGDKMRWKGIAVKWRAVNGSFNVGGWTYSNQPIVIDVMILKAPAIYTTSSIPVGSIFNDTSTDPINTGFMQPGYKVLAKKTIKITPAKTGDQIVRTGKLWLRRDQNIEFRDFDASFDLKDSNNYYLYFINRSQGGIATNITFAYQNYFVDS